MGFFTDLPPQGWGAGSPAVRIIKKPPVTHPTSVENGCFWAGAFQKLAVPVKKYFNRAMAPDKKYDNRTIPKSGTGAFKKFAGLRLWSNRCQLSAGC
ncbi:MAG: hypothetical protein KME26_13130 [Oscillatoria princeps RMCB-10]|nr:hypothetical protein [Oscillatoria princeps RMCB-10]